MKGITPVISMVLLLVITIVLSVFAFIFFGNTFRTVATGGEKGLGSIIAQSVLFSIENVDPAGIAYIRNTGSSTINNISLYVNGALRNTVFTSLPPGGVIGISIGQLQQGLNIIKIISGFYTQEYKLTIEKPSIALTSPTNTTYTATVPLTITVSANRSTCRYELDSINTTIPCSSQVLSIADGWHQLVAWMNDTSGGWHASQRVFFTVNTTTAFCGDHSCGGGESCSSCSQDCGACPSCGDGSCNGNETCSTCPSDCGVCVVCGDGECNGNETCSSCQQDCGVCIVPQATIFIDAGQHKGSVNDEVFGVGLVGHYNTLFQKGFSATLKNLGVKLLRIGISDGAYIGGNATPIGIGLNPYRPVSYTLGPRSQRFTSATTPDIGSYPAGPDEWGQRAREAGVELMIALPYGDGSEPFRNQFRNILEYMNMPLTSAIEAQASSQGWEVNYTNPDGLHSWSSFNSSPLGYFSWLRKQANNGTDPGPYNAKYWEIGNEVQFSLVSPVHSQEYILRAINISEYMQQIDPTIKVGAVMSLNDWKPVSGESVIWDAVIVNETIKDALLKEARGKQPAISFVIPHYYMPGMFELSSTTNYQTHSFFLFNPMNMNYKLQNGSNANISKTNVTYINSVSLGPGTYTFSIDALGRWETDIPKVRVRLIDDGGVGSTISNSTVIINNPGIEIAAGQIFIDNNGEQLKTYNLTIDGSPTGTTASITLTKPTQKYRLEIIFNYRYGSGRVLTGVTLKNLRILNSAGQQKAILLDDKEWYESTALSTGVFSEMHINKIRNYSLMINAQLKNQFPETSTVPDYIPEIMATEYAYDKEGRPEWKYNISEEQIRVNRVFYSALFNSNELISFINNKIDGAMKWTAANRLSFITYSDIWSMFRLNNELHDSPQPDNTSLYSYFPDYYMFQLLSNHCGNTLIGMSISSPNFTYSTTNAQEMIPRVLTENQSGCCSNTPDYPYYWCCNPNLLKQPRYSTPYLNGFATLDTGTGKLFLSIVNSNYNDSISASINIAGFSPATSATVRTFDANEADANGVLTVNSPMTNITAPVAVNSSEVNVTDTSIFQPGDLVSIESHCTGYEEYHTVSSVDSQNKKLILNDLSGQPSKIQCFGRDWRSSYSNWCAPYTCGHVVRVTDRIGIRTSTIQKTGSSFIYAFPAHSITVLEFSPQ
ncbi:MAG: hypothetical protein HZB67_03090 [Candidatus Aenigmarchaeota archaeon]|nr:hypothetical protein [Candidatus Aenigmarchaeota archaeon]